MEQVIRFCTTRAGVRIAYATVGSGPALVMTPGAAAHLEVMWEFPPYRTFVEAFAHHFTFVTYDRWGCGLSDRDRSDFSLEAEAACCEAVVDRLSLDTFTLLGMGSTGPMAVALAAWQPERVVRLILYGTGVQRAALDPAHLTLWQATADIIRTHWGLGAQLLSNIHMSGADAAAQAWFARLRREASTPEMAAALMLNPLNSAHLVELVKVPTLVLHRRADLAVAFEEGRRLAALLPNARLVPLDGEVHLPFLGDSAAILRAILTFCDEPAGVTTPALSGLATAAPRPARVPTAVRGLSPREKHVLCLLANGQSNRAIAGELAVSLATVERHIANLYAKIGARGRADAIAYAYRHGLGAAPHP